MGKPQNNTPVQPEETRENRMPEAQIPETEADKSIVVSKEYLEELKQTIESQRGKIGELQGQLVEQDKNLLEMADLLKESLEANKVKVLTEGFFTEHEGDTYQAKAGSFWFPGGEMPVKLVDATEDQKVYLIGKGKLQKIS